MAPPLSTKTPALHILYLRSPVCNLDLGDPDAYREIPIRLVLSPQRIKFPD